MIYIASQFSGKREIVLEISQAVIIVQRIVAHFIIINLEQIKLGNYLTASSTIKRQYLTSLIFKVNSDLLWMCLIFNK